MLLEIYKLTKVIESLSKLNHLDGITLVANGEQWIGVGEKLIAIDKVLLGAFHIEVLANLEEISFQRLGHRNGQQDVSHVACEEHYSHRFLLCHIIQNKTNRLIKQEINGDKTHCSFLPVNSWTILDEADKWSSLPQRLTFDATRSNNDRNNNYLFHYRYDRFYSMVTSWFSSFFHSLSPTLCLVFLLLGILTFNRYDKLGYKVGLLKQHKNIPY